MKIGFSSVASREWTLNDLVSRAKQYGYDGVELRGLEGHMHLPTSPALAADPAGVRKRFADAGVELACLASDVSLDSRDEQALADQKGRVREYLELAGSLGVPYVRILAGFTGSLGLIGYEHRHTTLRRIAEALRDLAPTAAEQRVTIVVENQGDFASARDMWYLLDAVSQPSIKASYSPFNAMTQRERPTNAVPCLGVKTAIAQICDGTFDPQGRLLERKPLGEGDVELARFVTLLRGIGFDGYLMVTWPRMLVPALAAPEQVLPAAQKFLKSHLGATPPPLSAYKSDTTAPTLGPKPAGPPARASA